MAEFKEVMQQYKRMCKSYHDCADCPFKAELGWDCQPNALVEEEDFDIWETTVIEWACEHPEPIYPTFSELFGHILNEANEHFVWPSSIWERLNKQIPEHIAKEYNIVPINEGGFTKKGK